VIVEFRVVKRSSDLRTLNFKFEFVFIFQSFDNRIQASLIRHRRFCLESGALILQQCTVYRPRCLDRFRQSVIVAMNNNIHCVPAVSKKTSSAVDGDVVGRRGCVEDGTAWSMIAWFQCSVPGCGASFTRKWNLLRHQTQKHGRPKSHARNSTADDDDDDSGDDDEGGSGAMPMFY